MSKQTTLCGLSNKMKPCPSTLVQSKRPVQIQRVQLHCDCSLPEDGEEPKAFCHTRRKWFHKKQSPMLCLTETYKLNWFCSHCVQCNIKFLHVLYQSSSLKDRNVDSNVGGGRGGPKEAPTSLAIWDLVRGHISLAI